ncbi:MAG: hypothetical protein NT126_09365 [Bacteroidetes bacterium]|nr:hypothetical protein [Bacteroidota bacterium]
MDHSNHPAAHPEKYSLFYTYFGETGASVTAFIYFLFLLICIFSFVNWG